MENSDSDFDLQTSLTKAISTISTVRETFNPKKRQKIREKKKAGPNRKVARLLPYLLPPASQPPRFRNDVDAELIRQHCKAGYGYPQNTGQTSGRPKPVSLSYDMDKNEFDKFSRTLFPKLQGKLVTLYKMNKQRRLIKVIPNLPSTLRDDEYTGVTFFSGEEQAEDNAQVLVNPTPPQTSADLTSDSDLEDVSHMDWVKIHQRNRLKRRRHTESGQVESTVVNDEKATSQQDSVESSNLHLQPMARVKTEVIEVSDEEPVSPVDSVDCSHPQPQESIAERRVIIAQQDQAFEEALAEDRRRAQIEEEKQERQKQLNQIYEDSIIILGEEPTVGVPVKVRADGQVLGQRRFRVTSDVQVLMAYIHTLRSSAWFSVKVPANDLMHSNKEGLTFSQIGITPPTIVDVDFNAKPRDEPLAATVLPALETEGPIDTDELFEDADTPTISFRRTRRAASIARQQVREWTRGRCASTCGSFVNEDSTIATYSDLISSLEAEDELKDDSEGEDELLPEESGISVGEILTLYMSRNITDETQSLKVSRNKEAMWRHSLRCFLRKGFSINKTLKIEFLNESGVDEGGLRREYLEILLQLITSSSLLCETPTGYQLKKNCVAEAEGHFTAIGRMIAMIIFQGGPAPRIFNHHFVQYGITGIECAALDSVLDSECRKVIEKIVNAPVVNTINLDDDVLACMDEAGVRLTLNEMNRDRIVRGLITRNTFLRDEKTAVDQFWGGAEELGLQSLLKQYPEKLEGLLCWSCGQHMPLTADILTEMLLVTPYGEPESNYRLQSEEVFMNFESFLYDVQDGKCSYGPGITLKLGDILHFITGLTSLPPAGLGSKVRVEFTDRRSYPTASTCALHIMLPLHLRDYGQFQSTMIESIISGPGFGVV